MWRALTLIAGVFAATQPGWMTGVEIVEAFSGKTVKGYYNTGVTFTEVYLKDGTADYNEPGLAMKGRWSVVNGMFCTIYAEPPGGCFRIARESVNCYAVYTAASTEEEARNPVITPYWLARAWTIDRPSTCPESVTS
jgi:hypothetical protein